MVAPSPSASASTLAGASAGQPAEHPDQPAPTKRRASKACSRCRRYRTKCLSRPGEAGIAPCLACLGQGMAGLCTFLPRGQSHLDRSHRRRTAAASAAPRSSFPLGVDPWRPSMRDAGPALPHTAALAHASETARLDRIDYSDPAIVSPIISISPAASSASPRHLAAVTASPDFAAPPSSTHLPPPAEVVAAIRNYVSSYFQLGFLHKALFVERYLQRPASVSPFLIVAICSIAAPFTPPLVERYGGKKRATDAFLGMANEMVGIEMLRPSLERAQAFLLIGVAEWGQGNGPKAWMLIGTAVRMAGFLGLHRETTYQLPPDPTPEEIIESEVARRTFWAIICHENLLSGQSRPATVNLAEIDVLLPCEESDFNFGVEPQRRSSLAGTLARQEPMLGVETPKSLFATLVEVKILWGLTARHACRGSSRGDQPWSASSQALLTALQDFEQRLPIKHRFSLNNLRGMTVEGLDLAFLSIALIVRLSHIVIRRVYLSSMAAAVDADVAADSGAAATGMDETKRFWRQMAVDMVENSAMLLDHCETVFRMRSPKLGFPPIQVFGVFMCGNVFSYLWKWPELCPARAATAAPHFYRCVEILAELSDSWPLAAHWHAALQASSADPLRQRGAFRTAARDERTLDDELEGVFGPRAHSIIRSPSDTSRTAAVAVSARTAGVQSSATLPTPSMGAGAGAVPGASASDPLPDAQPLAVPAPDGSAFDFDPVAPGYQGGLDADGGTDGGIDFAFDTFGDDLAAFLQGAVPTTEGDGGPSWYWDR
ncbi:hypothetical protein Q5752_003987 [Cryptotrichosporon argae]